MQPRNATPKPPGNPYDLPAVANVRAGVSFGYGSTGTISLPAISSVEEGVQYGAAGTEFTGTLDTGFEGPSAADIAAAVWDKQLSAHTGAGTTGKKLADLMGAPSQNLADYMNDPAGIADAVWDEPRADHATASTFGSGVVADSLSAAAEAQAVNAAGVAIGAAGLATGGDVSGMADDSAAAVWEYTERALTDKAGFVLHADYDAAKTAATQASVDGLNDLSAAGIQTAVSDAMLAFVLPDSYVARGDQPTLPQALLAIHQFLVERNVTDEYMTIYKPDGETVAFQLRMDSASNPTGVSRDAAA